MGSVYPIERIYILSSPPSSQVARGGSVQFFFSYFTVRGRGLPAWVSLLLHPPRFRFVSFFV
jgi:hypothetical protein